MATNLEAWYFWIGLLDCSIRIAIQFGGLYCDWQSKIRILDLDCQSSFCISIQIQKQSYVLSRNQKLTVNLAPAIKPSYFLSTFVLHLISWLIKKCLLGIPCLKHLCKILLMFTAFHFFSSSWIVIGLSIHFKKWIWIWILNYIFVLDLDWIDNPKNWIEQKPA